MEGDHFPLRNSRAADAGIENPSLKHEIVHSLVIEDTVANTLSPSSRDGKIDI